MPLQLNASRTEIKIKQMLKTAFEKSQINTEEILALLNILSYAENEKEIIVLLKMFLKGFPILSDVVISVEGEKKMMIEQDAQEILRKMMVDDPLKAAEIAKRIMKGEIAVTEIKKQYPQFIE
jgi:hypothetical protein